MRLALAAAALVLLAGCTSGGKPAPSPTPTGSPAERVHAAPAAARNAGGATYAFELAGQAPGAQVDSIRGNGRIDFATDTAATRGDLGLASGGRQLDVVTRGTTIWVGVPPALRTGYVKRPWVSTSLTLSRLGMNTLNHPATAIDVLTAATDVSVVGRTDLDGIATTHYRSRVEATALVDALPAPLRDETRRALQAAKIGALAMEVWLDDEGRPRRIRTRPATATATVIESGFDVLTYGAVEPVVAPSPAETAALPTLAALLNAVGVGAPR